MPDKHTVKKAKPAISTGKSGDSGFQSLFSWKKIKFAKWFAVAKSSLLPAVIILWLLSGFFIVNQDETAVVRRFGAIVDPYVKPGINWRFPWPIERADKIRTTEIKRMSIGYKIMDELQGIPPDPMEIQRLTGDTNIIEIKIMVQYQITKPADYMFNARDSQWLIRKYGEAALTRIVNSMKVDDVLTTGKLQIQSGVRKAIQDNLDRLAVGITVISCNLQDVSPPADVLDAFNDVARAKSDKEKIKSQAEGYRNDLIPRARGEAMELLNAGYSYQSELVNRAKGQAESFLSFLKEYLKAEDVTRRRLFLEMIELVLPDAKKVIIEDSPESQGKTVIIK